MKRMITRMAVIASVVVDGGKELLIVSLTDANTVYGVMKKINRDED